MKFGTQTGRRTGLKTDLKIGLKIGLKMDRWMMGVRAGAMIAIGAVAAALAGGNGGQADAAPEAPAPAASPAKAPDEVRIGYFANLTHAQAVLGVSSGDFEKAVSPSKFSTKVFNAGPSLIEALFAGEIDMGYVGPGPALTAFEKSKGEGVKIVAGAAANGVVIVASKESGIKTLKDLAGKRIATPQLGNTQDIAAKHYLMSELKQSDLDKVIPVPNAEQSAMMLRGQIDAAWAPEPWGARLVAEAGGTIIAEEKDLWPNKEFVLTAIVVRPEFLKEHPDVVKKVLEVHQDWTAKLQADAEGQVPKISEALLALTGKKLDADVLKEAISRVKFTDQPSEETLRTMSSWAFDLGFARRKVDISALVDRSVLDQLKKRPAASSPSSGTSR